MLGKALVYVSNAKYEARRKFVEKLRNRNGMEMLQMVILIAIAISIAALFFMAMQKFFPAFWGKLEDKINALFGGDIQSDAPAADPNADPNSDPNNG